MRFRCAYGKAERQGVKSRALPHFGLSICAIVALCCLTQTAIAETIVYTLRDSRPVAGIDLVIVKVISGKQVQAVRSGQGGIALLQGLEDSVIYEAQTSDGASFTRSFAAGDSVELEIGLGGWSVASRAGFALGTSKARYKSPDLDVKKADLGGAEPVNADETLDCLIY